MNTTTATLTTRSHDLFMGFAEAAGDWSGTPLFEGGKSWAGNLTDLKKVGLLTTSTDEGCTWILFTEAGEAYALAHGIDISGY